MDAAAIASFVANSDALLTSNASGGLALSESVLALAGTNSDTLEPVIKLLATANESQRSAIAAGLARTAAACALLGSTEAADYGDSILEAVASSSDPAFVAAYESAANDINDLRVAALSQGTATGGGSTAGGAGAQSGVNTYRYVGDGPIETSTQTYSAGFVNAFGESSTATSSSGFGQ